jgi:hypothetical protein
VRLSADERVANLTLTVTPGPRVRVVFTGDPLPGDRRVELVPVEREGSVDEDLLEDSSNRIEEYLRAQGYRDAKAAAQGRTAIGDHVFVARGQFQGCHVRNLQQRVVFGRFRIGARLRDGQPFAASGWTRTSDDRRLYHRRVCGRRARRSTSWRRRRRPRAGRRAAVISEVTAVDALTFANRGAGRAALRVGCVRAGRRARATRRRDAIQLAYQDLGYRPRRSKRYRRSVRTTRTSRSASSFARDRRYSSTTC